MEVRLELATFEVKDIVFSHSTSFSDGFLYVSKEELRHLVLQDSCFVDVELDVARPGEKTRIINILDVIVIINMILGVENESALADLNGDGSINIQDIILLVNYIFGGNVWDDCQLSIMDVNGDSNYDILDMVALVTIILGT